MRANSWSLQRKLCTLCELPARRQQRKLWALCELTAKDNRKSAKKARHAMQANSMKTAYTHRQLSNPSRFFANQCLQSQRSSKGPPDVRVQSRSQSSSAKFSIHSGSIHHRPTHIVAILSPPPQHQLRSQRRSRHIPLFFSLESSSPLRATSFVTDHKRRLVFPPRAGQTACAHTRPQAVLLSSRCWASLC